MIKFLSICQTTFIQTIRQPIFSVLLMVAFFILVMGLPLTNWAMSVNYRDSNQRMIEGLGLSTLLMMGLFAAAFSASGALAKEIDNNTALTVVAKPVPRAMFVLGKFVGVTAAVGLFYYLTSVAYLMTVRHKVMPAAGDPYDWPVILFGCSSLVGAILVGLAGNFLFNWTFTSAAVYTLTILLTISMALLTFIGKGWEITSFGGEELRGQLIVALALLFMAVMVFVSVAIAASTRLGQVATLLVCCGVFFVGSIHASLFTGWNRQSVLIHPLSWACPDLGYFYPIDAVTMQKDIPLSFVALAGAYCAMFVGGVLAVGAALFERRSLEAQTSSASMPALMGLVAWAGRLGGGLLVLLGLDAVASLIAWPLISDFDPLVLGMLKESLFAESASNALVLLPAAGLILAGAALWLLWGYFGKGATWSYWTVTAIAAIVLLRGLALTTGLIGVHLGPGLDGPVPAALQTLVAAGVLLILILPKTRRHFQAITEAAAVPTVRPGT